MIINNNINYDTLSFTSSLLTDVITFPNRMFTTPTWLLNRLTTAPRKSPYRL